MKKAGIKKEEIERMREEESDKTVNEIFGKIDR